MQYDGYSATTSHATSSCFVTEIIFSQENSYFCPQTNRYFETWYFTTCEFRLAVVSQSRHQTLLLISKLEYVINVV